MYFSNLKVFVVKTEKYDIVGSTIMLLELIEGFSSLQNFKGLPYGLNSVKENGISIPPLLIMDIGVFFLLIK